MQRARQAVLSLLAVAAQGFPVVAQTPARPPVDAGKPATPTSRPAPASSQGARSTITARIDGLRGDRGMVFVSLFDSKRAFDDNKGAVAIGESKRFFERWRTLPDRSIATSIAGAERSVAAFATV
ncbi:MAG: hypothetical protein WCE40_14735 [Polyangia bacterium]